jgi:hypothetical protein
MGISEDYYSIVTRAERKTPAAIYIGDGEQAVLYDKARKTHDLLRKENLTVHCVELGDMTNQVRHVRESSLPPGSEPVRWVNFHAGSITGS